MLSIPVLVNHDFSTPVGNVVTSGKGELIVELDTAMSKAELFNSFGNIGMMVLESTFDSSGQIEHVRRFKILEFSTPLLGA